MKLAIFGATGKTGLQLVKQGLEKGHSVKALVRSEKALEEFLSAEDFKKVELVKGNASEAKTVQETVQGTDVVLVSLGGRPDCPSICSEAQALIDEAIKADKSVKRQVLVTSLGVGDSYKECDWFTWAFVNLIIKKPIEDKNIQESTVQKDFPPSDAQDWVFVRPGGLTDRPATGQYKVAESGIGGGMVSRADVAHFIINKCLEGTEYSRKAVTIVG